MQRLSPGLRLFAAAIALIAGYVDAIGFVGFGGMFVSFMSGNSTRLGAGSAAGLWQGASITMAVIGAFVGGVAIGQAVGGTRDHRRGPHVLLLVAAALAVAAWAATAIGPSAGLLAAAFAMGAINTVPAASPLPVGLTYMTGTLVKLGQSLGQRLRGETPPGEGPYLVHWLALVTGAALGATAYARWTFAALWVAAVAAGALALTFTRWK